MENDRIPKWNQNNVLLLNIDVKMNRSTEWNEVLAKESN